MTGSVDKFEKAMEQGHSAAWDQLWERAASYYQQALEEFPAHPAALSNLGLCLFELQRFDEALRIYARAATISPDDPLPFEKIAQLSLELGKPQQASLASQRAAGLYLNQRELDKSIENYERVVWLNPDNLKARLRLASLYSHFQRMEEASREYLALASILQRKGEVEKASQAVQNALQMSPQNQQAHQAQALLIASKPIPLPGINRGWSDSQKGLKEDIPQHAGKVSVHASELDPINQAQQIAIGMLAGMIFEFPEEETASSELSRRGLQSLLSGNKEKFTPVTSRRSGMVFHLGQALDLLTRNIDSQAAEELQKAKELGLEHPAVSYSIGMIKYRAGDMETAISNLQHALSNHDLAMGARLLIGQILRQIGRMDEAAIQYLEALKLADSCVVSPDQIPLLQQNYEALIEAEILEVDPQAKRNLCDNVEQLLSRSDWKQQLIQARGEFLVEINGGSIRPIGEILIQTRSGQIIDSINSIQRLVEVGHIRSAMEEAFQALDYAPTYLPLHAYMGELLLRQNHLNEAVDKFFIVAQTYATRGEMQRAVEFYRKIIHLTPMNFPVRNRLIDLLIADGQIAEAIDESIDQAETYINMADLSQARKSYLNSYRLAENAHIDTNKKVAILKSIADIDIQSLDWREALRIYEQIRTYQPNDQQTRASIIDLNFRLAQKDKAFAELQDYITYLVELGQRDVAISFLKKLAQEYPDEPSFSKWSVD